MCRGGSSRAPTSHEEHDQSHQDPSETSLPSPRHFSCNPPSLCIFRTLTATTILLAARFLTCGQKRDDLDTSSVSMRRQRHESVMSSVIDGKHLHTRLHCYSRATFCRRGVNFYGHPPADAGVGKRRSGNQRKTQSPTIGRPDRLYYGRGIITCMQMMVSLTE
jgi:hypothetical protein